MDSLLKSFDFTSVQERLLEKSYRVLAALPLFALALVLFVLIWQGGRWLSRRKAFERVGPKNPFMQDLARTTVQWVAIVIGLLVALEIMDATTLVGAVLGTAGALGVALGFAFRDILENYLAGILMGIRQPFAPKDHIVIDGNEGVLISLTSRATTLMTLDGNHLRLPNALVFRSVILNYTRNPRRRFSFDVGIGVNEDLVRAQQIGVDELRAIDGVIPVPPPRAFISALGDSNVQVRFHGWVDQKANDFLLIKSEAIRRVKLAMDEAGMDMPEPIYRVQLREAGVARPEGAPKPVTPSVSVDTRAHSDVVNQIDDDVSAQADDLLDPQALRE